MVGIVVGHQLNFVSSLLVVVTMSRGVTDPVSGPNSCLVRQRIDHHFVDMVNQDIVLVLGILRLG